MIFRGSLFSIFYEKTKVSADYNQVRLHRKSRICNRICVFLFLYPQLAEELLNKEVLNYDDIVTILGPCPFGDKRVHFSSPEASAQSQSLFSG